MNIRPFRDIKRRKTKKIKVGKVEIGGDAPISVQSMTNTLTTDVNATIRQINELTEAGADIVRVSCPDKDSSLSLKKIVKQVDVPIVADIHFHYQLALEAIQGEVDCLRLNPGNIRDPERVKQVVQAAKERQIPIRIGVNFGSLPPVGSIGKTRALHRLSDGVNLLPKAGQSPEGGYSIVDHMVDTALWEIGILEALDFDLIKISLKAFDVYTTVEAYRRLGQMVPYPFHLGITEAGTAKSGSVRSAVGLGVLLYEGIGDTIRVSLTEEPEFELPVAKHIVKRYSNRNKHTSIPHVNFNPINPFEYDSRKTRQVLNIGGDNVPRVIVDLNFV